MLVDVAFLFRCAIDAHSRLELGGYFGQQLFARLDNGVHVPHEEARIPIELAALYKDFGQFQLRFLREGLHLVEIVAHRFVNLDVSVSGLRAVRLDAQRQEFLGLCHKFQALLDGRQELVLFQDQMVRRRHHDVGVRVQGPDVIRCPGNARGSVASCRLQQNLLGSQFRQLLLHQVGIQVIGHNQDVLFRYHLLESVVGLLQQ